MDSKVAALQSGHEEALQVGPPHECNVSNLRNLRMPSLRLSMAFVGELPRFEVRIGRREPRFCFS
jgi:hypothetical protein